MNSLVTLTTVPALDSHHIKTLDSSSMGQYTLPPASTSNKNVAVGNPFSSKGSVDNGGRASSSAAGYA